MSLEIQSLHPTIPAHFLAGTPPRQIPLFSDEAVTFLSSIVVLTPNGQFLGCATTAFSERHYDLGISWKSIVIIFGNGFETRKLIIR